MSIIKSVKQALNPAFLKQPPTRDEIELFKKELNALLDRINENESEEFHKNLIKDFLNAVYYKDKHYINTKGRSDLVVHNGENTSSPVGVLIETKSPANKTEMIRAREPASPISPVSLIFSPDLNKKSFHELVLYYLRERKTGRNIELRYLIITNVYEWFVFDARNFEDTFGSDTELMKRFSEFENKTSAATKTDTFYREIAAPAIERHIDKIEFAHFDIRNYEKIIRNTESKDDDRQLIALYKFLSPVHLLKLPFANDNNQLNREFYAELLHIIGLEEITQDGRKLIVRKKEGERHSGSIIENAMERIAAKNKLENFSVPVQYGSPQHFDIALDLAITWINRILFLKLLESQILKYHNGNRDYAFLSSRRDGQLSVFTYNDLDTLFFSVLARKENERPENIRQKYAHVPYLNSSLFEMTEMEDKTICIDSLQDNEMLLYAKSVLRGDGRDGQLSVSTLRPLEYLLRFLDAYDFSSEGSEDIQEENKQLISASVLGLIFEKINGYKDGSFFTPSFITMYMCRETIGRAVVQKFNHAKGWNCQTIGDVYNKIDDIAEANAIFNAIRICDPAVGSGHFLVSALNEMIYLKSELGILTDKNGKRLKNYRVTVENDELIITDDEGNYFVYNPQSAESQRVQETFFHEKQTIIENCLFGVDINPNSVKICQLRLWIELLKHAYYLIENGELKIENERRNFQFSIFNFQLQTLPNIDINIKCGNSLMSRFDLADKYHNIPGLEQKVKQATKKYKEWVSLYKTTHNKEAKRQIVKNIENEKAIFYQINNARDVDYQNLQKARSDLALHTQSFDVFAQTDEWSAKTAELSEKIQKLEAAYNEKIRGCFEWRFEFPEVLDENGNFTGFDAVIGNPPYGVLFSNTERNYFKHNYKTSVWRGESYLFFIERGLNLLKQSGLLTMIIPDTLLNLGFTQSSREFLLQNSKLKEIVGLPSNVFAAATVDTIIFLTEKANFTNQFHSVNISVKTFGKKHTIASIKEPLKEFTANSKEWFEQKAFNLQADSNESILLSKIEKSNNTINDIAEMFSGIKSYEVGKGKPAQTKKIKDEKPYTSEIQIDKSWQPFFDGKHIGRYQLLWKNNNWIKYGQWLAAPRNPENFEGEKILIRKITGKTLLANYIPDTSYCNTLLFVLKLKDKDFSYKSVLGVLNSNLIGWYFRKKFQISDDDTFPQIMIRDILQFPIPKITNEQQQPIITLVNEILEKKKENPVADTAELEREIDGLVYGLYGLTEEEVKIIEGGK